MPIRNPPRSLDRYASSQRPTADLLRPASPNVARIVAGASSFIPCPVEKNLTDDEALAPRILNKRVVRYLRQEPLFGLNAFFEATQVGGFPYARKGLHAIVVLGVPANLNGTPSCGMRARVSTALACAQSDPTAVLVVSGGAVGNLHVEANVMGQQLIEAGIAEQRILFERRAWMTQHNATFALIKIYRYAQQHRTKIAQVTVVAEPFHIPRGFRLFACALKALHAKQGMPEMLTQDATHISPQILFASTERLPPRHTHVFSDAPTYILSHHKAKTRSTRPLAKFLSAQQLLQLSVCLSEKNKVAHGH